MKKNIAILGSTGSIGTQALEVINKHSDKFNVVLLTANNNCDLLISQAIKYNAKNVVIANDNYYLLVKMALQNYNIDVFSGSKIISEIVKLDTIDLVITAMVGYSGLLPTINSIIAGKDIALANKETLVVAGDLITKLVKKYNTNIYPVDSEHSAIFQCLIGEDQNPIEKIYLTASGGPFRVKNLNELKSVTKTEALRHPNWEMGAKITIDSASLMNKGLEAIEAKWLFNLDTNQIDIIIHPQSIIHSIVQFEDGSMKAQMGLPDMKLPILYALGYPKRYKSDFKRFSFLDYPLLSFEKPDFEKFRNLTIAFSAMKKGGNVPCIMNAANEIVVEAFLNEKIGFLQMPDIIEETIQKVSYIQNPSYEDYVQVNLEACNIAKSLI